MCFHAEFWPLQHCVTAFQCLVARKCLVCVLTACPHPGYLQPEHIISSCLTACPLMRPPGDMVSSTGPSEGSCRASLLTLLRCDDWMCAPTRFPSFTQLIIHSMIFLLTSGLPCYLNSRHQTSFGNPNMYSKFILM